MPRKKKYSPVPLVGASLGLMAGEVDRRYNRPWKLRHRKVKPNEPCPCGSGKKYKHCHDTPAMREETARRHRLDLAAPGGDRYVQPKRK